MCAMKQDVHNHLEFLVQVTWKNAINIFFELEQRDQEKDIR